MLLDTALSAGSNMTPMLPPGSMMPPLLPPMPPDYEKEIIENALDPGLMAIPCIVFYVLQVS